MTNLFDQQSDETQLYEIYFANGEVGEADGLVWKEILREGTWAYRPGAGAKPVPVPLKVVAESTDQSGQISMADLIAAFEDGAIDHVTVPTSHEDKPQDNTGYVRKLKIKGDKGKQRLVAGIEFTEPDIEEKARRRSIAGSSCGIIFDYVKKDSGKKYKQVIGHVALTNKPWINGMEPFSEYYSEQDIVPIMLEDVVWDSRLSYNGIAKILQESLEGTDMSVKDISGQKALVNSNSGNSLNYVIPFSINDDNTITLPSQENWIPAKQEWIKVSEGMDQNLDTKLTKTSEGHELSEEAPNRGAGNSVPEKNGGNKLSGENTDTEKNDTGAPSNEPATEVVLSEDAKKALLAEAKKDWEESNLKLAEENETLRKNVHEMRVDKRIGELKKQGFKNYPAFLSEIRTQMLADTGNTTLTLSEEKDGKSVEVELTATEAIERFIEALPKKDGRLNFGEQALEVEDIDAPPSTPDSNSEFSEDERIDAFAEALGKHELVRNKKDGDE